jgi:hypothetical protein
MLHFEGSGALSMADLDHRGALGKQQLPGYLRTLAEGTVYLASW